MASEIASGIVETGATPVSSYTLLIRAECHLCEDFLEAMRQADSQLVVRTTVTDVDSRADWRQRFGLRIPVLIDGNGAVIAEGVFDPARLAD